MTLTDLSTKDLIEGMTALLGTERQAVARLVAYLAEIDARGAYLDAAYSSLQDFCIRKLGLSEGEAFRRINAARLARRFPVIVEMIEAGDIHLTALVTLRDYLTEANHLELLRDASRKTKAELAVVVAARFPRADVEPSIRRASVPGTAAGVVRASLEAMAKGLDRSITTAAAVEPLSATRYRVELTVDAALKEKLERAAVLMGQRHPRDLEAVMSRAVELLIDALEKERFGKTDRPAEPRAVKHGYISRAVRREVWRRDEERCAFVSETGERCPARTHLQYDHCFPRALGGSGKARNVRLLCRAHNLREAERIFGKKAIAERVRLRQRKRSSAQHDVNASASASAEVSAPMADPKERLASESARCPVLPNDQQRPTTLAAESPFDIAERALRTMGFRMSEARAAVGEVRAGELDRRNYGSRAPVRSSEARVAVGEVREGEAERRSDASHASVRPSEARAAVGEVREGEAERRSDASRACGDEPIVENILRAALAVLHRDRTQGAPHRSAAVRPRRRQT